MALSKTGKIQSYLASTIALKRHSIYSGSTLLSKKNGKKYDRIEISMLNIYEERLALFRSKKSHLSALIIRQLGWENKLSNQENKNN
ncbi:MAG: hypothetical protein ACJAS3_002253 [Roseivirga sp.]|jgi:hypothetical protein